jgi:hypothetical protein
MLVRTLGGPDRIFLRPRFDITHFLTSFDDVVATRRPFKPGHLKGSDCGNRCPAIFFFFWEGGLITRLIKCGGSRERDEPKLKR